VAATQREWADALRRQLRAAIDNGELPPDTDVEQVVFEIRAVGLGLNQELMLHGTRGAVGRARKAVKRSLRR
jgi:hypothetical protein